MSITQIEPIPELEQVFKLLTPRCPKVFIAGGAAVDYAKASDVDLYFPQEDKEIGIKAAKEFLEGVNMPKKIFSDGEIENSTYSDSHNGYFKLVGEFFHLNLVKPVQVIWTTWDAEMAITMFDISTHMVAIGSRWDRHTWDFATTAPDEPPTIYQFTPQTLKRYLKICARYGHKPDMDGIDCLVRSEYKINILDLLGMKAASASF